MWVLVPITTLKAMKYIYPFLLLTVTLAFDSFDYESKLREDIIAKLPKDIQARPSHATPKTTQVNVYIAVNHIVGLDPKTESFAMNGRMYQNWDDESIKWNKHNYDGLSTIRLPEDIIWKPKLYPYNSARLAEVNYFYGPSLIFARFDGKVFWSPAIYSETICPMDFRWFPYDQQDCFIELGTWSISAREVNVTVFNHLEERNKIDFMGDVNNEWELIKYYSERYNPYPEYNWHSVKIHFQLRRRAPYYQLLLVLPIIIGIFLCLVSFWIPATPRVVVISFNLLHLTMFIAHIYWVIPKNGSSAPAILILTSNTLALTGVSLLFYCITAYIEQRTDENFPSLLQNLLNGWLGKILRVNSTSPDVGARLSDSDNVEVEVAPTDKSATTQSSWMLLATAIDRLMFIIYVITFFIIIIVAFA